MKAKFTVEADWITASGLRAVVTLGRHRCGYGGVPKTHRLHGVESGTEYDESMCDVHGGVTYSGGDEDYPVKSDGLWWFGFDCAHYGDAPAVQCPIEKEFPVPGRVVRSLAYCKSECESLATQLAALAHPPT